MALTIVETLVCNRGQLSRFATNLLPSRAYLINGQNQGDDEVQYWGSAFLENDDTTSVVVAQEVYDSLQLYRKTHRIGTIGHNATNIGRLAIWVPRNYKFAIHRVDLILVS